MTRERSALTIWLVVAMIVGGLAVLVPGHSALAAAPQVSVSRSSFDFGNIPVGTMSAAATIYVNNFGDAALTFAPFTVTPGAPTNTGEFTTADGGGGQPICTGTLNPGQYCVFTIRFAPQGAAGPRSATVNINDNAADSPQKIAVSGVAQIGGTPNGNITVTIPSGGGTVNGGGNATFNANLGTTITLTPTPVPAASKIFEKWIIDGRDESWANPLSFLVDGNHTVAAYFIDKRVFSDVSSSAGYYDAVTQLASRGIINGCNPPDLTQFCPADTTLREQMAALIVRALPGWQGETWPNTFTDQTSDTELMRRVGTLQHYGVVGGYTPATCQALGLGVPCYGPLDPVLKVQAISFITRALVKYGLWQPETVDDGTLFPNVTAASGHRTDVLTYYKYVKGVPDVADPTAPWQDWTASGKREWFSRALWLALLSTKNINYG